MTPVLVQTDFSINAFMATQVIFDDSDLVSVSCTCRIQNQLKHTTLLFTFATFNDFLRHSGSAGAQLQDIVCKKLLGNEQPPYLISLQDKPLVFVQCKLELAYLIAQDDSCLSVEAVKPISFLQQAQNLRHNIKDFGPMTLNMNTVVQHALEDLSSLYRFYLGLKELNLTDEAARTKAGLQNDKIFKLAYYAAK
ncbi:MAG: hypothetical protein JNM95_00620 [Chitinophagaceae bacterium]|nr:hypothetical protein [Chitinophagaceae bacterium]